MAGKVAAFLAGIVGLLTLVWKIAAVGHHFESALIPVKVMLALIALAITLFVLMVASDTC